MSQKSSVPQAISFVSQVLKRDSQRRLLIRAVGQHPPYHRDRIKSFHVGYVGGRSASHPRMR